MKNVTIEYASRVAAESESSILSKGGEVLSVLPYLDRSEIRPTSDLIGRALALNAVIDLNFKVPSAVVRNWIFQHNVEGFLTAREATWLELDYSAIPEQDKADIAWSLDALWALMWAGNLVESIDFWSPIPDTMYELCPHIRDGDGPEKFANKMKIRSFDEIYRSLDLYYRLHWYAFQYQIRDEFGVFDLSRFIERRKALEWLVSPNLNWDNVSLST